jgi:septum formation protein
MSDLILASTSSFRKELLQRIVPTFRCVAPNVLESQHPNELPYNLAVRLAKEKAQSVAVEFSDAVIIGSDQVACLGPQIFGKPLTHEKAVEQLSAMSGQTLQFITAVCVIIPNIVSPIEFVDVTTVEFIKLTPEIIEDYLSREDALQCAGSFKSEGLGISLIQAMQCSDPTGLVGLPLIQLSAILQQIR